jgi:hypothetical protein
MRRLRAMAALDPELDQVLRERAEGLRTGLRVIVSRLPKGRAPVAETVDLLFALTSFESFDLLAGPDRTPAEVGPLVKRAAAAIVGPKPGTAPRGRAR